MRRCAGVLWLSLVVGCTTTGEADGGTSSGGTGDAAPTLVDAGAQDAAATDAATSDAATSDAATTDAGRSDAAYVPPNVDVTKSLAWTQPALLDDPTAVSLRGVLDTMCPGSSPGALLEHWLHAFNTTAHSERAGPALLADELVSLHGADATVWPLESLPFRITGVHNRLDLQDGTHCGEFRVSLASSHPIYRPLHFIFLFRMDGDCVALARRFASLSALDEAAALQEVRTLLNEHIRSDRFLLAESVEFTVSPWEWRQWTTTPTTAPGRTCALENPPLFQQLAPANLNSGPLRAEFLQFVETNAAQLNARRLLIPASLRQQSVRANQGVPWVPLDLAGVRADVLTAYPNLRQNLEMVGCAACHATDAPFIQTAEGRTFSPFYQKELNARAVTLREATLGNFTRAPFGPLQPDPVLPP